MDFKRNQDSFDPLSIGLKQVIKDWLKKMNIESYKIRDDLSIDVLDDINLKDRNLEELPEFIQFNVAYRGFYASGNMFKTLKGFPRIIVDDLSIQGNIGKYFPESEIRESCHVRGNIYN